MCERVGGGVHGVRWGEPKLSGAEWTGGRKGRENVYDYGFHVPFFACVWTCI
jgi:hypothetical protein